MLDNNQFNMNSFPGQNDQFFQAAPAYGAGTIEPGLNGLKITRMLICDTGSYGGQHRRPYHTTLDANSMNVIRERLEDVPRFAPALIGGVASAFIQPTADTECALHIPNGWDTPRLRFMIEVEYN